MERRDELSAHTFARKRTLAAFLQPESRVSDEEAPRPVRAIMPSAVMSIVLVVGCIAWGAIAPSAPPGWDKPGEYIIVDSDSTTRYVVLTEKDKNGKKVKQLHPVLNFASAKLVLDKGKGEVIEVAGEDIDASGIARGATIGIPYAPDRLPSPKDAETPKEWAVCEKPAANGSGRPQQGVFVLGGQDKDALKGGNRLADGEALFVEDSKTGDQYVVDGNGTKLMLAGVDGKTDTVNRTLLTKLVLSGPGDPQMVSSQWLSTLRTGEPLEFPTIQGTQTPAQFEGVERLPEDARIVGSVLKSVTSGASSYYVVMSDRLQQTSQLYANIVMGGLDLQQEPIPVSELEVAEAGANREVLTGGKGWPEHVLKQVNREAEGIGDTSRTVSCSVYTGNMTAKGPELATWAGSEYPAKIVAGSASAYVSPGSGLLYREISGGGTGGGGRKYLLTDSGLRYALASKASIRLGYEKVKVARVPQNWSSLLPKGPTLATTSATQEQAR